MTETKPKPIGSHAVYREAYLVGDTLYNAIFVHDALSTFCIIHWKDKDGQHKTQGAAYCNPNDEFNSDKGEYLAMQRACRIGCYPQELILVAFPEHDLRPVYSAYREARFVERMG